MAEPKRKGWDDPRERVVYHRSTLVLDDGHPTHPKQVQGREVVVTVTREKETRTWWMRLLGVYPPNSVTVDVRKPGVPWFLSHGTLAHGGETCFTIRSVDE